MENKRFKFLCISIFIVCLCGALNSLSIMRITKQIKAGEQIKITGENKITCGSLGVYASTDVATRTYCTDGDAGMVITTYNNGEVEIDMKGVE